jgi:nucleoside-diphosphate-sugar epimerase
MPWPDHRAGHALVTGAAGFIGSALCEALVAEGWRVTGVDAFIDSGPRAEREAHLAGLGDEPRFDLVEADLADAPLGDLVAGADVVAHLAGRPGVRSSFGDGFAPCLRDNLTATQRILEAALEAGTRRVVWASSSSVYGDAGAAPADEHDTPLRPRSPYGVSKRACEDLAAIARTRGLDVVGLRYFTVYGPRQRPDMALRRMCEALCGGPGFTLLGDGAQVRDMTHVHDVVDATLRAMTAAAPAPVYNVGGGAPVALGEVIATLEAIAGAPLPLRRAPAARGDVARTSAGTGRARADLGWSPRVGLAEGLAGELAWVRARARVAAAA